ncbi:MAG: bifunctional 3-(3-hydroxy-phenyl)propionate/3-hydroxycinnamic acid hydroxylase [Lautropia sp.]
MSRLEAQVVVVGAGPCGVTLANLLGVYGIRTIVLERETGILDYPRAVGVDDEALRSWQTAGLAEELIADMIQNAPARYHNSLGRCFAHVRPQTQPFGWPRRNMFLQPLTEATLRKGLGRFGHVSLKIGWHLEGFVQTASAVELAALDDRGEPVEIHCEYLVGADGGRSTVRKALDVEMEGMTHSSKWLVVDCDNDRLYAPYSAVFCHPQRPHMSIDLPYAHRRFEFMLLPDDREADMQSETHIMKLIAPHYPKGVPLPRIKRSRIYLHHSRIAKHFRLGRAFLAGDAAHLQPPFFGQGMNSGIRDATNLGWKLAAVLTDRARPKLLDSYEAERRDHALQMVNIASWFSSFYRPRSRVTEMFRDAFFDFAQRVPSVRDYVLQLKFKPMPRYTSGVVVHSGPPGKGSPVGRMFMQPQVENGQRVRQKVDDAVGPWFAVLGMNFDPRSALGEDDLAFWDALGAKSVQINKSRLGRDLDGDGRTLVLDDVEGAFRDWTLEHPRDEVIVLRPDRYVAATCSRGELAGVTREMRQLVH